MMPHKKEPVWAEKQLTQDEAIAFAEGGEWKSMTKRQITEFQMYQRLMCMPFDVFHEAVEDALGRPVWTHEFAYIEDLQDELQGNKLKGYFDEVMAYLDPEKTTVIDV